ncbi:MAG: hypothetical protein ACQEXJ_14690 [Myxococcota bacterium]
MRTIPTHTPIVLIALMTLAVAACGDSGGDTAGSGQPTPDTTGDATPGQDALPTGDAADDSTPPEDTSDPGPAVVKGLGFEQAFGDDDQPCQGSSYCTLRLSYNEQRSLRVVYTEDGEPTADRVVKFDIVDDSLDMGHISALSAYSNGDGVAEVTVKTVDPAPGQFTVKAHIDDPEVPPLFFDVVVTAKGQVPLTVVGSYAGVRNVGSYQVRLFPQDGSGAPGCGDLEALMGETAAQQSPVTNLGQSVKFLEFPGLEDDGTQQFTVLAYAEDNSGVVLAWGCDDQDGTVSVAGSSTVEIVMADRPPLYAGSYEVRSVFDFTQAIPEPYATYVDPVLDLFQSPTGGLLTLTCKLGVDPDVPAEDQGILADMCDLVFQDPGDPSIDEADLTTTGGIVVDVVDAILKGISADTVWGDVLQGGKEISDMLTAFEIRSTLVFLEEPGADGHWTAEQTSETWDGVTVKWSLGDNCDPLTDDNCGKKNLYFGAIQPEEPVVGSFEADVEDFWALTIAPHPLSLQYGTLLDTIIQKVLLPRLAGDDSEGGPAIDSYEKLISSLLGGKDCLLPSSGTTCCENLVDSVLDDPQSSQNTANLIETACGALIAEGADYLTGSLTGLSAETGEAFLIGTGEACQVFDADHDMTVDGFGTKSTPCTWKATITVGDGSTTLDADFWAARIN